MYLCSNLEKAQKELEPEDDLINPKLLYPAFAVSMIVNLLMGGHILSQVCHVSRVMMILTMFCYTGALHSIPESESRIIIFFTIL